MEFRNIPKQTITGKLWWSFGLLIFVLALTTLIYYWQSQRINSDVVQVTEVQEPLQRAALEMQLSAGNTAWAVSEYIRNRDPADVERVRDSEVSFEKAVAEFDELTQASEVEHLSQEMTKLYKKLKGSTYEIMALVDQQYTASLLFQEDLKGIDDLINGALQSTIDESPPDAIKKLEAALNMQNNLDEISISIESYMIEPDPRLLQEVLDAQADFNQFATTYRATNLSAYEDSWLDSIENQFEEITNDSAEIFAITDNLHKFLGQFEQSLGEIDAYLNDQVQPFVYTQAVEAFESVQASTSSATKALIILSIIGALIGAIAVLVLSRKIANPIRGLADGAKMVASGKFEYRFNIDAGGEFGQLAFSLNQMLNNLRRSREMLGESEEMAWALLDSTSDAVMLTDHRGIILASNEVAAERYGMSLEQIIDMSLFDLLPAGSETSMKSNITEVIHSKKSIRSEYEREGKIIDQNIFPIFDGKGEISRIAIFARDITVRKWVEEVTEQLGRRNELILEAAGEGIYGLDTQGMTTFVNPAAARMLGYKPEDLIGKRHHELVHHSKPNGKPYPPEHCPIYATFKDGTVHTTVDDEVFWRKDGTSFPIQYTSTPIIENSKILGAVVTFQDITQRKQLEKVLRQNEKKYRSIFEDAANLIISVDKEGFIIDCNSRIQQVLGYKPAEIIGHNLVEFVDPDEHIKVQELLKEALTQRFEYNNQ